MKEDDKKELTTDESVELIMAILEDERALNLEDECNEQRTDKRSTGYNGCVYEW